MKPTKAYLAILEVKSVVKRCEDGEISDIHALQEIEQINNRFMIQACVDEMSLMFQVTMN